MYKIRWAILRKGIQTVLVPYHHTQRCFAIYDKSQGTSVRADLGWKEPEERGQPLGRCSHIAAKAVLEDALEVVPRRRHPLRRT